MVSDFVKKFFCLISNLLNMCYADKVVMVQKYLPTINRAYMHTPKLGVTPSIIVYNR